MAQRLARGAEEAVEVQRVQNEAEARLIGNVWVKWDRARDAPKRKPADVSKCEGGLGAYVEDVRERLLLFGYSF